MRSRQRRTTSTKASEERSGLKEEVAAAQEEAHVQEEELVSHNEVSQRNSIKTRLASLVKNTVPLLLACFLLFLLHSLLSINSLEIYVNNDFIESEDSEYHNAAQYVMDNSFLGGMKPFYRSGGLAEELSTPTILISEVSKDTRIFDDTIRLYITESRPSIIYKHGDTNSTYLVDSSGVAYRKLSDAQEAMGAVTVFDRNPAAITAGDAVINPSTIVFINNFNGLLQRSKPALKPVSYTIDSSERFLNLRIEGKSHYLKLASLRPADSQLLSYQDLLQFLDNEKRKEPSEYVDLRIDGQTAYR